MPIIFVDELRMLLKKKKEVILLHLKNKDESSIGAVYKRKKIKENKQNIFNIKVFLSYK